MSRDKSRCGLVFLGIAAFLVVSLLGCAGEELDREAWKERSAQVLAPFKAQLMGALMDGLQDGPESAISVCQLVAPEIAAEVSSAGIEVGRTSHKLRNERNAPREWMRPLLTQYRATPGKTGAEVVQLEDGAVGYVEPIFVNQVCLACHGTDIAPGVASRLDALYPRDQARGFGEGDFRGLFWVEWSSANADSD